MNAASGKAVFTLARPRTAALLEAVAASIRALLAHVKETGLDQTHAADDLPAMDARLLRDIGVEAAWRPALYRELQYPRL
jgi:uncharacterized protein YjiS (DUF1127 family)